MKLSCPEGWLYFQDSCYKNNFYPKGSTGKISDTFPEALQKCRAEGATLAEVSSDVEYEFLRAEALRVRNGGLSTSYWNQWWLGMPRLTALVSLAHYLLPLQVPSASTTRFPTSAVQQYQRALASSVPMSPPAMRTVE